MESLLRTEVVADQIDHLGHMNVRFYGEHARQGARQLLARLGLLGEDGSALEQVDTYVRHHREQLLGAHLEVRGGVLDVSADRLRLYEELRNADTEEVAATFVLTFVPMGPAAAVPDVGRRAAEAATVELPEHGRPRSISLDDDPVAAAPPLDVLAERDLAFRHPRAVAPEECDADGDALPSAIASLVWGGRPVPGRAFRPLIDLPGGGQMGFATMETRASWARRPRVGDGVQSFAAVLDVGEKTLLSRHWLYDVERRSVLGVFTIVNLAFDLTTRRSTTIPDAVRHDHLDRHAPDLA